MFPAFKPCRSTSKFFQQHDSLRSPSHVAIFSSSRFQDASDSSGVETCVLVARAMPNTDRAESKATMDDLEAAWSQYFEQTQDHSAGESPSERWKNVGHEKGRRNSEALFKDIIRNDSPPAEVLNAARPPGERVTRLLSELVRRGHWQECMEVLAWADSQSYLESSKAYFYSTVFAADPKRHKKQQSARQLYARMRSAGILHDVVSYNAAISALGQAGHLQQCQKAFAEMQKEGFVPDVYTYTSLIKACQVCGSRWSLALEYLQQMKSRGVKPNVVTYTTLISCCQRAGQWSLGMRLFRELDGMGLGIDLRLANSMISACAQGGRWEDAWAITSSARRVGLLPNTRTYNALLSACQKAGQAERALEVFQRMCKDAETRPEAAPTMVSYNTLMNACANAGLYNKVGQLFKDLQEAGLVPDRYTLAALIQACKRRNFWEEAIEFADTFKGVYGINLNTISCNALISTLGRAGRWQYALQYFDELDSGQLDGRPDHWTYAAVVLALRRGGEYEQVWDMMCVMQARKVPIYRDVYFAALEACERLGLWGEGQQVLQTMQADSRMMNAHGLDIAAWKTVFAFPPLMDSVPKPILVAARAAVDGGKLARRLVSQKPKVDSDSDDESEEE